MTDDAPHSSADRVGTLGLAVVLALLFTSVFRRRSYTHIPAAIRIYGDSTGRPTTERAAALTRSFPTTRPALLLTWAFALVLLGGSVYLAPMKSSLLFALVAISVLSVWLVWHHPELGLLVVSFSTTGLVPRNLFSLPLAGLRLDPADIAVLGLLAVFVIQGLQRGRMEFPQWSVSGPLMAFAGFAVFSALYARFYEGVNLGLVVGELRPAVYCLGCAIAAMMIARRRQLTILLAGLFMIADLTAGAVILEQFKSVQGILQLPPNGTWQINQLGGAGGGFGSVRVVPPGHVLVYLMAIIAFCLLLGPLQRRGLRVFLALQLAFLSLGLVLTYTRAQWIASGIAVLLVCTFLPLAAKKKLGRFLLVAVPVVALAVGLFGAGLLSVGGAVVNRALVSRFTSLLAPDSTAGTASLEWRSFEVAAAGRALNEHPLVGVGPGNDYRDVTLLQGEASGWLWELGGNSRLTRWVHDSYLYIAVKMGVVAAGVFLWFCLAFLVGGARAYASTPYGPAKFIVLAVVCSFAGLLEWAVFEAHFMLPAGMATVGLMLGIVIAVASRRLGLEDASGERAVVRQEALAS